MYSYNKLGDNMYPIIGIIMRPSTTESNKDIKYAYDDIIYAVIKSKGIPICIPNVNFNNYLDMCDGFILQGGDDIEENNLKIINILKEKNIPLLGICLGMQEIAKSYGGTIYDINNHKNNTLHEIIINKDSLLYKILKCHKTLVNSRHNSAIKDTDLFIGSKSNDNIIESVEDKTKKFLLGLQWHPENMYDIDHNSRKIFDYFIKVCNDKDNL